MGKPVSGLTAAQVVAKSELVTQAMKEPKMTMKKQPFWVWKCNWRGPKNKPCDKGVDKKGKPNKKPMVIEGRNYAVVLRTCEGHWNFTHLKEAQAEPERHFSTKGACTQMKRDAGNVNA